MHYCLYKNINDHTFTIADKVFTKKDVYMLQTPYDIMTMYCPHHILFIL